MMRWFFCMPVLNETGIRRRFLNHVLPCPVHPVCGLIPAASRPDHPRRGGFAREAGRLPEDSRTGAGRLPAKRVNVILIVILNVRVRVRVRVRAREREREGARAGTQESKKQKRRFAPPSPTPGNDADGSAEGGGRSGFTASAPLVFVRRSGAARRMERPGPPVPRRGIAADCMTAEKAPRVLPRGACFWIRERLTARCIRRSDFPPRLSVRRCPLAR